ncbi:hypothetical protein MTF64_04965 [Pseudoalteromonas sp. 2CM41L]|uniref:ParE family toxin-like protein n=1 Tax=Pseudoalteromonas sp. 2CM41L TaxID=2929857 RepID=UPI0020C0D81D|nr:hypothetical protein [Pseudoalteromonas sp. 2CM41L]MCK8106222.1 hypothetical protein [Pseudoalteromonas sp. 2CM41L]
MSSSKHPLTFEKELKKENIPQLFINSFNTRLWQNLSANQRNKIESLINAIATGKPYSWFGGQKIKSNNSLIRFRIGRNYRLLLIRSSDKFNFQLFNRQNYELNFKRNSSFSNGLGGAKQWN